MGMIMSMTARRGWIVGCVLAAIAGCQPVEVAPTPRGSPLTIQVRSDPWTGSGRRLKTTHYEIFTTVSGKKLGRYLPGFMEAAHDNYRQLTGLSAKPSGKPLTVYMMANRQEWDGITRHKIGRTINIEAGGYCHNGVCVFWDIGIRGSLSVASHEGLHQFFYFRLRDRLPMWLEEGMCTVVEGFAIEDGEVVFTPDTNGSRFNDLRNAMVGQHWRGLTQLLPMHSVDAQKGNSVTKAVGYYGQLWALAMFVRTTEPYRSGLRRMLDDAEAGRFHKALGLPARAVAGLRSHPLAYNRTVSEPLFRHYISADLAAFEREYRAFAEELVGLR